MKQDNVKNAPSTVGVTRTQMPIRRGKPESWAHSAAPPWSPLNQVGPAEQEEMWLSQFLAT